MKYIVSFLVESSKAYSLFRISSAPFTVKQVATGITPRGLGARVIVDSLDQNSLPCFKTNQRRRQVLCTRLVSLTSRLVPDSPVFHAVIVARFLRQPVAARHKLAIAWI
ncbi:hypothetical protein F3Y22_tig00002237pilonHSYRG00027 [Hibiscus syriacus]|uniref:Uncharacterized protein n=1 Tax=Hibiscus syriacus TaxID=106335 RepID=A0A6A3CXK4_HIBSY|nr:hypothetical protein F3Y22_tig00002237pilonHSYRG00027 [Hibiscus syriacus]